MSELLAIGFPSEEKAEAVRQKFLELQKSYIVEIEDCVVAVKTEDGRIKLNQLVDVTTMGALSGGLWGTLIGTIFLNPILGAALGAAGGALSGLLTDYGLNDNFMKDVAQVLTPGNAALFVLLRKFTEDKVLDELRNTGGTVLRTSLDRSHENELRDALSGIVRDHAASGPAGPVVPPAPAA